MAIRDFIGRYFIDPVMSTQGYNIYNTLAYAILFLVGLYLAGRLLKRMEMKIDEGLFWSLMPFVFLGGIIRALGQYTFVKGEGILPMSFWFFTPGIYILIAVFTLISLGISLTLNKERPSPAMYIFGGIPALIGLAYILVKATNYGEFLMVIGASLIVGILLFGVVFRFWPQLISKANILIISGFVLDTTTTSMATAYFGYAPEHVLTGLISSANPFIFLPFKLSLILAALYYIEKDSKEGEKWIIKIALLILGLPHGIHDSLQILMGV
jgi:uncharacterized membrane protein